MPDVSKLLHETLQRIHLAEKAGLAGNDQAVLDTPTPISAEVSQVPTPPVITGGLEANICPATEGTPSVPPGLVFKCADRTPAAEEDLHLSVAPLARVLVKNAIELGSSVNDRMEREYFDRTEPCIRQMYPLLRPALDVTFKSIHHAINTTAKGYRDASPEKQRRAAEDLLAQGFLKAAGRTFPGSQVFGQDLNAELVGRVHEWFPVAVVQRREGRRNWLRITIVQGGGVPDESYPPRMSVRS